MKNLSKIVVCLVLVIALTLSMTACVPTTPNPPPSVSPSAPPTTPPPTSPTIPSVSPSKTPGGSGISFPDGWDRPIAETTIDFDKTKLEELDGNKTYRVEETTSTADIVIENPNFTGKLIFGKITATSKNVTINMPKATVEFADVDATTLNVTSGLNTAIFSGKVTGKVTILGGNTVINDKAVIADLDITKQSNVNVTGEIAALTANAPLQINLTGDAVVTSFVNKAAAVGAIKTTLTVAENAKVKITNSSDLVVDALKAEKANVTLITNSGTVELVKDINAGAGDTKGEITVDEGVTAPTETYTGILTIGANPLTTVPNNSFPTPEEGGKYIFDILQFNYQRKVAGFNIEYSAQSADGTKTYISGNMLTATANDDAMFQWAMRDLSDVDMTGDDASDQAAIDAVEQKNEKLVSAGTEVVFVVTATKDGKSQTLTYKYTITAQDVENAAMTISGVNAKEGKATVTATEGKDGVNVAFKFDGDFYNYDVTSLIVEALDGNKVVSTKTLNLTDKSAVFAKEQLVTFKPVNDEDTAWTTTGELTENVPTFKMTLTMKDGTTVTTDIGKTETFEVDYATMLKDDYTLADNYVQNSDSKFMQFVVDNIDGTPVGQYYRISAGFKFPSAIDYTKTKSITATLNYPNGNKVVHTADLAKMKADNANNVTEFSPSFYGTNGIDGEVKKDRSWWATEPLMSRTDGMPTSITLTVVDGAGNVFSATSEGFVDTTAATPPLAPPTDTSFDRLFGTVEVTTEAGLKAALAWNNGEYKNIIVTSNLTLASALEIMAGQTVTIVKDAKLTYNAMLTVNGAIVCDKDADEADVGLVKGITGTIAGTGTINGKVVVPTPTP